LATKYLHYYLSAANGKGHGIHSPFVFDFVNHVLNDKRSFYAYAQIENLRKELLADHSLIEVQDFGAGSVFVPGKHRSVASIARHAAKSPKLAQLLFRIVNYYQPTTMLELGTSLGLSAAYLASGNPFARLITLEGAASIARLAKKNFKRLDLHNIELVTGNFDDILPAVTCQLSSLIDLAFIDGNHRKGPTLSYFNQIMNKAGPDSIFIFDDIHWSREMEEAWQAIKDDPRVMLTVDLFFLGLVFFRKDFKIKQHFTIRF
jgi:predicted O-methyltransferase YrrM